MLQLGLHSPPFPPSISSSSSSSSSSSLLTRQHSIKLFSKHSFSPKSLPSKPNTTTLSLTPPIKCCHSDLIDQKTFASETQAGTPNASVGALPPRVLVGHSLYKGKAALKVNPKPPEFTPLNSGAFKISKEGYVLLQFAPAIGLRQYDWSKKQVLSLSVAEMGSLISLGARESCEFFRDPFKGKSDEGKIRKILKVEPLPDGSGHLFKLSVQNKLVNIDESIHIPVTKADLAVLSSIFNFIIPYLLGWHAFANSIKPEHSRQINNANSRYGGDNE